MRAHLGGSSRQSLAIARTALDAAVKSASAADASRLSSDLFLAADVIGGQISLRRALTDPARSASDKAALVKDLFGSHVGAIALSILSDIAAQRWSGSKDLILVLEQLAVEAEASAANIAGELDRVEDEFFAAAQAVASNFELRKAFISPADSSIKATLVSNILASQSPSTQKLVTALVSNLRGRSIESAFDDFMYALAVRRNRVIALVRVATELTSAQRERLSAALTKQAGQPVRVNIEVDSSVVGGVSVQYADELVDATVSTRLARAGRAVVGNK